MFTALLVPLLNSQYHDCDINKKWVECVVNNSRGLVYSRDVVAWLDRNKFNDTNLPLVPPKFSIVLPLVPPKWGYTLSNVKNVLNVHNKILYLYCMFENVGLCSGASINVEFKKNKYIFNNVYTYSSIATKNEAEYVYFLNIMICLTLRKYTRGM